MSDLYKGTDRRRYPRFSVHLGELLVEVGPLGARRILGEVLDISRSGVRVKLESALPEHLLGGEYVVSFVDAEDRVEPEVLLGRLSRAEADKTYAVHFKRPLDRLEIDS